MPCHASVASCAVNSQMLDLLAHVKAEGLLAETAGRNAHAIAEPSTGQKLRVD